MDQEKEESSEIKTHKEIMALFDDLQTLEKQVKNPEPLVDEPTHSKVTLQEVKPAPQPPTVPRQQQQILEPAGEIHYHKNTRQKQLLFRTQVKEEEPGHRVINRISFLNRKKTFESEPEVLEEVVQGPREVIPLRSTFILDIDSNGNLVGFPMKKQKPGIEKVGETVDHPGEEPAKGIKGKLLQIGSRLRRRNSSEGESEGIVERIKGIFRRKS